MVYDVSNELRVHAGFARYFTPPPTEKIDTTSVQKFLGTTNALPSDANTAVKSERSNYYDVGAALQVTPQVTFGVDAYYRKVQHLQDEGQFGNALIFSAFNYAQGQISGIDLSTTFTKQGALRLRQPGMDASQGQDSRDGSVQLRPGRARLHQRELGSPRPRTDSVRVRWRGLPLG